MIKSIFLLFLLNFLFIFNLVSTEAFNKEFVTSPATSPTPIYCPPDLIQLEEVMITTSCPKTSSESCSDNMIIRVRATAVSPENKPLNFKYSVSGGKIVGQGANVKWDLTSVKADTYTISLIADDGDNYRETSTRTITVKDCDNCQN